MKSEFRILRVGKLYLADPERCKDPYTRHIDRALIMTPQYATERLQQHWDSGEVDGVLLPVHVEISIITG